ncbi:hypothetical protein AHAS_Ahas12G0047900 [Arachis hypogaea]
MLPNGMCKLVNLRHLDIRGTPLKEMPKGISKLKQLHILSKFVVGKKEDNGIQELGGLLNLHGSLEIERLENVVDANEARSARIIDKKHIEELLLKWSLSSGDDMVSNTHTDEQDILHGLQPHTGLKELTVEGFKVYQNMTKEDAERWYKKMSLDGDRLSIRGFESVAECGFKARIIHHLTCLQEIQISDCSSVVSLGGNCLPKSLQKLKIFNCHQIELLQQQHKYDLVELRIEHSCDSLTSLSLDAFPNLENLQIVRCSNLESVSMSEPPQDALQHLTISNCPQFVSFPQEGLATPNLTHLHVSRCWKLEALPRVMNTLLPNLESLDIAGCPNICRWPEGGLPANLKELRIGECEEQVRGLSWLGNLDNLTHLTISGHGSESIIESYPEVGWLHRLPSLTTLHIQDFHNLETLECNELLRLTSLQELHISWCHKLENIAGEKLPPSLLLLQIDNCHLLGKHCKNKHKQIWSKISHIPTIQVDGKQIF